MPMDDIRQVFTKYLTEGLPAGTKHLIKCFIHLFTGTSGVTQTAEIFRRYILAQDQQALAAKKVAS